MDIYFIMDIQEKIERNIDIIKTEDQLKQFINDEYFFLGISDETHDVFAKYYKTRDYSIILNYISQSISKMPDDEKVETFIHLCRGWEIVRIQALEQIFMDIQDKNKILDRYSELYGTQGEQVILNNTNNKVCAEYVQKNWKNNLGIVRFFIDNGRFIDIFKEMNEIDKINFMIEYVCYRRWEIQTNDILDKVIFEIKDDFLRKILIICIRTDGIVDFNAFQKIIGEYQELKEQIENITDEQEKVDFITSLKDNEYKLEFLKQLKLDENRKKVIQSLDKNIDPSIKMQVELVQRMIREFFEDKMGEKLTREQKERLEIAFAKTTVEFGELERPTNGLAHNLYDYITISNRHLNNPSKSILFLLHEYGHILSQQNLKKDNYNPNIVIEEGMQDTFSELVMNYYLEKYGRIELNGRRVRMDYPCKSYSCYDIENSWTRTMLYPLERQGKDIEAVTEYILGDKNKFLELTLGKENADKKPTDLFGNKSIDVSWKELYGQMPEGFEKDDIKSSIYGRRNCFLPILILQKELEGTDIDLFELEGDDKYFCDYVADKYFGGRKLYEISPGEMTRFLDLYDAQKEIVIFDYDKFMNKMINELTGEEIKQYSTRILDTSLILARNIKVIGTNIEDVWMNALTKERQNVEQGQSVDETAIKYKMFIENYTKLLGGLESDESEFLMDSVNDLKDAYLQQMEECIRSGNVQEVLKGLRNKEDGTIFADKDILEMFERLGVKFEQIQIMGTSYNTQDIVESAIRAKIKLEDVKRVAIMFENDKSNELIGEMSNDK